ncbi:helix-turn-helix domain-containing protein [Enemella sp. A6]|uniref:helix-turn-helix domain-containing protein n=1 Tax=Enemella sp. A6 TaxID=3440152 RepID=UPI003EB860C1
MSDAATFGSDSRGILDPGRMAQHVRLRRFPAEGVLADLVRWFWVVEFEFGPGEEFVQPVLSHPAANLSVGPRRTRRVFPDRVEATAVGVCTGVDHRHLTDRGWNVAATLRPGAFGAFLRQDAETLTDRIVALGEVVDLDDAALVEQVVAHDGEPVGQVAELAAMLEGVVDRADPRRVTTGREVAEIGTLIETDRTIRSTAQLAASTGVGVRTLQRLFREHAGVSPLWMIRRYRLIDAADAARAGRPPSWGELAAGLGYADQAHLTRDFKATVGMTPNEYARSVQHYRPE